MSELSLTRFKCCTKCNIFKPASFEFFYRLKSGKYGFHPKCKTCSNLDNKAYRKQSPPAEKRKQYIRKLAWMKRNPDKVKAQQKAWREANSDKVKAIRRKQYIQNKERENDQCKQYYWSNREQRIADMAVYREANREYFRRWRLDNREKRRQEKQTRLARKAGASGSHTQTEVWQMLEDQCHVCCYCEVPLFGNFHVEHMIPLSRGGSDDWSNLGISCGPCNTSKGSKTATEFINLKLFGYIFTEDIPRACSG